MRRTLPYFVFAVTYPGLLFVASFAEEKLGSGAVEGILEWWLPAALAPLALLVSARLGTLTSAGVALTSFIVVIFVVAAILLILVAIAVPTVGSPTVAYVSQTFVRFLALSGWFFWLNALMLVAVPWLWSLLLFRRGSHATRAAA